MLVERIEYQAGNVVANGALVYDENIKSKRPLLLMSPNWLGVTDHSIKRAASMASSRYIAFVADMYGGGKIRSRSLGSNATRQWFARRCRRSADSALMPRWKRCAARVTSAASAILTSRRLSAFASAAGTYSSSPAQAPGPKAVVCLHGDLLTSITAKPGDIKAAICVHARSQGSGGAEGRSRCVRGRNGSLRSEVADARTSAVCCIRSVRESPTCRGLLVTTGRSDSKLRDDR